VIAISQGLQRGTSRSLPGFLEGKSMKDLNHVGFAERLKTAAKARAKQLERARGNARASEAGAGERDVARRIRASEREERAAAKAAAAVELKARRVAEEASRVLAEKEAIAARKRELEEAAARDKSLHLEQKAARDARYAARKARGRK
jgi:hypothetical protein